MPELCVGNTRIPYEIRHSDKATRKRIIVTPNLVEVVAPSNTNDAEVIAFVQKKRRWVYDKKEEMDEYLARFEQDAYMRLQSGAKIPFRGRNMRLRITRDNSERIEVHYQNGFHVTVPKRIAEDEVEKCVGLELTFWLKDRLKEDARQIAKRYSQALNLKCKGIRIGTPSKLWASCTKTGLIKVNWHLIAAPKPVLEYVILHEVCHLKHRNHSNEFWALLASQMPDYTSRKKWLETMNPTYSL